MCKLNLVRLNGLLNLHHSRARKEREKEIVLDISSRFFIGDKNICKSSRDIDVIPISDEVRYKIRAYRYAMKEFVSIRVVMKQ